ncbi:hypothetical protein NDS46_03835 [Paenibacillus thiaminolyticus]|uniref:hypothetical protein n=1 Tax=Paenibacillus thiaminolyticus TaxID=49283 RepID=UPI00232F8EB5|nr:hypothetical protein [Paenibacillus thiaminolyticus]WCF09052.1 hypothetical protein NDS46_03835 [Paenibacillus thiaminolyticus]
MQTQGKGTKSATKYPEIESGVFGVGAVRNNVSLNADGGTGNTGSCGVNISCILCCCCGSGGGAENKKAIPNIL